ncbi:hypothetical protein HDU76_007930 [Blyttiomyces sp. JEL0837]|nr:hypothetical protein HDU76_007930 [Blyttiomyces sp. JEL0837]
MNIYKAAKLTASAVQSGVVQKAVVKQITQSAGGDNSVLEKALAGGSRLAIEAPPPRADVTVQLEDDLVELNAFFARFRPAAKVEAGGDVAEAADQTEVDLKDGCPDIVLNGVVKISLNQDFDHASMVDIVFEGILEVDTERVAASWIKGGAAAKLIRTDKKAADEIKRPVSRFYQKVWTSDFDGKGAGLKMGDHTFPFAITISRSTPATAIGEYFTIKHSVTARFHTSAPVSADPSTSETPIPQPKIFSTGSKPITIRRVREYAEPILRTLTGTYGTSRDGLFTYEADAPVETLEGDTHVPVSVVVKLVEGVDETVVFRNLSVVYKQATRINVN